MKTFNGNTQNLEKSIIGKVTYKVFSLKRDRILIFNKNPLFQNGIKALITNNKDLKSSLPHIQLNNFDLNEGDIVKINIDGLVQVLWEVNSSQNTIYMTDYCNSKCIMCPQPMSENSQNYHELNMKILELVDSKGLNFIGITGGEPTLNIEGLGEIINLCKKKFQHVPVFLLTNGKNFSKIENLNQITNINHKDITFCVPLYADNDFEHDYIVGASNSFNQTINGLYNLAKLSQKIEIRIVILKQNYKRLQDLSEFIYRNLPFVSHIAFMGMEYTGLAKDNLEKVYIDPQEYSKELFEAVQHLVQRNMHVSIYNLPLCLVPKGLCKYTRDSISSWKKFYIDKCDECNQKTNCSGLFETSIVQSSNIVALKI